MEDRLLGWYRMKYGDKKVVNVKVRIGEIDSMWGCLINIELTFLKERR